jgi:hypothetical protein
MHNITILTDEQQAILRQIAKKHSVTLSSVVELVFLHGKYINENFNLDYDGSQIDFGKSPVISWFKVGKFVPDSIRIKRFNKYAMKTQETRGTTVCYAVYPKQGRSFIVDVTTKEALLEELKTLGHTSDSIARVVALDDLEARYRGITGEKAISLKEEGNPNLEDLGTDASNLVLKEEEEKIPPTVETNKEEAVVKSEKATPKLDVKKEEDKPSTQTSDF